MTPVPILRTDYRLLPGGWVGVDVFFVLSGYLITRLLLVELDARGAIDRRVFYLRRVRRLLPALAALLVVWMLVAASGLLPVRELGSSYTNVTLAFIPVVGAFTLLYNWLLAFDVATPAGMGHLWTLSVEEQFYVVWLTIIVVVAARFSRPQLLLRGLVVVAGTYSVYMTFSTAVVARDSAYFGSFTSGLGLLVGAGLALFPQARASSVSGLAGLCVIVACALFIPDTAPEVLAVAVLATSIGAALLIVGRGGWSDRLLTSAVMGYLGRRSYAISLWSSPLAYATVVWGGQTWWMIAVLIPSTLLLAELSWRLVERRFLVRRPLHAPDANSHGTRAAEAAGASTLPGLA